MDLQEGDPTSSQVVSGKAGWPESSKGMSDTCPSYPQTEQGLEAESQPKTQTEHLCMSAWLSEPLSLVVNLVLLKREQEIGGTTCFMYQQEHNFKLISMAAHGVYPELAGMLKLVKGFQCATSKGKTAMTTTFILFYYY